MATLELVNVKKAYGDNEIIHGANININDGELIVIVGPSGCGKSSLLRMIAGLEEVSSGEIKIDGKVVNNLEPKDRNIAMVFQNYALYPHMTVYQNMAYGLRMRGQSKQEIKSRVDKTANILELEQLLERTPRELSGGQRQRVAMGRAIVREPAIFLFDEPLSNLDAKLRVQMRLQIKKLQKELNTTSVYVTHDQVEAMTLADRLVLINKGRVEQVGDPIEIYNQPASTFVGGFIGSPPMNFLSGIISSAGNAVDLSEGIHLPLGSLNMPNYAGREVTVGIRPEKIFAKEKQGADWFNLKIEMVEALGADTLAHGRLPCGKQSLTARLPSKWRAKPGDTVTLAVMPHRLHLFDAQTGMRLH